MQAFAVTLGLLLPVAWAWASLRGLAGADAIGSVALLALSATLSSFWPLGGGMAVDGTFCTRFATRDFVHDARRSTHERFLGPFLMSLASLGCFFIALPLLAVLWRLAGPAGLARELVAVGALLALVVVGWARHTPEAPLARWRQELEAGATPDDAGWMQRLDALARIAGPDGALGHVSGIGAGTVGLHEHLDALEILERAAAAEVPGARELREKGLRYLESRREPGGFPVYPGALPRQAFTARAERALRVGP